MKNAENIPYLSGETLAGLGITTGDVIDSICLLYTSDAADE